MHLSEGTNGSMTGVSDTCHKKPKMLTLLGIERCDWLVSAVLVIVIYCLSSNYFRNAAYYKGSFLWSQFNISYVFIMKYDGNCAVLVTYF